eukprot:gene23392-biopygen84940
MPHAGGRLFMLYCVDAYCKAEAERLAWVRNNQKSLRADTYQGLQDFVNGVDGQAKGAGRTIILPSSYTGGPRYMQQNYMDAMAIVAKYGKPDYFITFTASAEWPEIKENLRPGEKAHDRPDLVARVFHLYLQELLCDLTVRGVLGRCVAYTYTVEFQPA